MLTVLSVAYPLAPVGPDAVGGAEQILTALEKAVSDAGHRSLVLACEGSRATGQLFTMPLPGGPLTPERRAQVQAQYRAQTQRIVEREAVDVVHFHGIDFHTYLPEGETPLLATLHLPPEWYPPEIFAPARPKTYLNCVSRSQRQACPPCAVLLGDIPNGVDLARFVPGAKREDFALVLSRVCPEKGIHLAIEAARRAGVSLVIAGEVFPYPEHIRYFLDEVKPRLDESVRFIGPVGMAQKAKLLACARCVVVPSLVPETSSLVAMEALASGSPVIAFSKGALLDLVEHGRTGFLVNDVEDMAKAIRDASQLQATHCRMAAEAELSQDAMSQRYLSVYAEIAERRPFRAPAGGAITVDELDAVAALEPLSAEWNELWERCPEATVFQRPEWLLPWCAHLLRDEARVVTVRRGARLIGLAPFFRWMDGKIGVLSLMGAGVSDYLDVLVDDGDRGAATQGVKQWLRDSTDWERCEWSELRTSSLLFGIAETLGPRSDVTPQDVCPAVVLGGLARIRDAIPARKWADVACARRRAERGAGLAVDEATAVSLDSVFDRLEALHAARWRERGDSGMLTDPSTCAFHRDASRRLMARGALMLYALRLGSEVAAVLYGFHDRRATRCYLSGFDPAHARQSPGTLVVAHALQEAHRRGADVFDLLRGAEPYKREWGAQDITRIHRISVRRTEADPIGSPPSHCPAPPQPSRSSWAVPR